MLTAQSSSYAAIYSTQPNVRTVVDYIARIAVARTLGLYKRQHDGEKEEDALHPAAVTLNRPNDWQGGKELLDGFFRDILIYDNAYFWDMGVNDGYTRFLVRIPPHAVQVSSDNWLRPHRYRVWFSDGTWMDLSPDEVIHHRGYSAMSNKIGTPALETLRQQLVEESARQAHAIEFVRGGMVKGGIIERPIEAPEWSDGARERFERDWAGRLRGVTAGKSPVLEEGMHFVDAGVSPREAEAARAREFALSTAARLYGLHPGLFGVAGMTVDLESARDAADEDVVVPLLLRVAETLTVQLVGHRYGDPAHFFAFGPRAETSIDKLGKAAKDLTTTVMAPDEFRKDYLNKPPLPGGMGQKPILNPGAALGGAPPRATDGGRGRPPKGEPDFDRGPEGKAQRLARLNRAESRRKGAVTEHAAVFARHFQRQRAHVAEGGTNLSSKRWNDELARDMLKAARVTVESEGSLQAERLMGTFDMGLVKHYLEVGAKAAAEGINIETAARVSAAHQRTGKASTAATVAALTVMDDMINARPEDLGQGRATQLLAFATLEAGRQNTSPDETRYKVWIGSGKPNSRHTGVSGEHVPLFESFSNGMQYPGDHSAGAAQTAKCQCLLDIH